MPFLDWMFFVGLLCLASVLGSAFLRPLPLTNTLLYLAVGIGLGLTGVLELDLIEDANWLERVTEVVVIVSLFVGGLKLRLSPRHPNWRAAYLLALPAMVLSIAGVALIGHFALGLTPAAALLLGAVLAPTDPVLADEFSVSDARDRDRLRYGLSGEAGLNDGTAFPFVVLALLLVENDGQLGAWVGEWALLELVWAVPAGLLIGFGMGFGTGRLAVWVRQRTQDPAASSDLLLIALVALSYGCAELVHAWGFLSVFAAGVGLRQAEVLTVRRHGPGPENLEVEPTPPSAQAPAEELVKPALPGEALAHPSVASGAVVREVMDLGEVLERIFTIGVVLLVGVLMIDAWDWRGVWVALALFFVVRPLAVGLCLLWSPTNPLQRWLMAWFGVRGIGSIYYLAYAIGEGLGRQRAEEMPGIVLTVIALSIVLHGVTATPLLNFYQKRLNQKP